MTVPRPDAAPVLGDRPRVVGTRQVLKALHAGRVERLYVAVDAAAGIVARLVDEASRQGVVVDRSLDLRQLGRAGGVEVGAAAMGILREPGGQSDSRSREP